MTRGKHNRSRLLRVRRTKAVIVVLVLVLAAPGIDVILHAAGEERVSSAESDGVDVDSVTSEVDAFAALNRLENDLEGGGADISTAFAQEVGFLPNARDVRASGDGSVVGYVVDGEASEVLSCLTDRMESCGWTTVPLGYADGATFVKSEGACTWALTTCTQVGSVTSVVTRCSAT